GVGVGFPVSGGQSGGQLPQLAKTSSSKQTLIKAAACARLFVICTGSDFLSISRFGFAFIQRPLGRRSAAFGTFSFSDNTSPRRLTLRSRSDCIASASRILVAAAPEKLFSKLSESLIKAAAFSSRINT